MKDCRLNFFFCILLLVLAGCASPERIQEPEAMVQPFAADAPNENQTMQDLEKQSILSKIYMIDGQINHVEAQIKSAKEQATEHQMFPTPGNVSMASSVQSKINELEARKIALMHQRQILERRNQSL